MKKIFAILFVCLTVALFTSCRKPVYSVEWYKQNEVERKTMLDKCGANPDSMRKDKNCLNAADAQFLSGSYTKSPERSW